jgi:hypothetical protein
MHRRALEGAREGGACPPRCLFLPLLPRDRLGVRAAPRPTQPYPAGSLAAFGRSPVPSERAPLGAPSLAVPVSRPSRTLIAGPRDPTCAFATFPSLTNRAASSRSVTEMRRAAARWTLSGTPPSARSSDGLCGRRRLLCATKSLCF